MEAKDTNVVESNDKKVKLKEKPSDDATAAQLALAEKKKKQKQKQRQKQKEKKKLMMAEKQQNLLDSKNTEKVKPQMESNTLENEASSSSPSSKDEKDQDAKKKKKNRKKHKKKNIESEHESNNPDTAETSEQSKNGQSNPQTNESKSNKEDENEKEKGNEKKNKNKSKKNKSKNKNKGKSEVLDVEETEFKLVIRKLPPNLSKESFLNQFEAKYPELFTSVINNYYVPGNYPMNDFYSVVYSRSYINCDTQENMMKIGKAIKEMEFTDDNNGDNTDDSINNFEGAIYRPVVEKAFLQMMPTAHPRPPKADSMTVSKLYKSFVKQLESGDRKVIALAL